MKRNNFLKTLGMGVLAPGILLAQTDTRRRPSFWNLLFRDHPVSEAPNHPDPASWRNDTLTAAWIGHSTVLINFYGTWIITDPILSEKAGLYFPGLGTAGPKRLVKPALKFEELPQVDLILSSHAHFDHLDMPTLRKFGRDIPIIMAKYTSDIIVQLRKRQVRELDWGESAEIAGIRVEALRVRHFGWRYPWEQDRSKGNPDGRSYNAYLLSKNGHHIVFGGDTAYCEYFKALGTRGLEIDLAIMPIGSYDPWIRAHANPEQAVAMANDMRAKNFFPIHWGTFIQSSEPIDEPITRLKKALAAHSPKLAVAEIGEEWEEKKL